MRGMPETDLFSLIMEGRELISAPKATKSLTRVDLFPAPTVGRERRGFVGLIHPHPRVSPRERRAHHPVHHQFVATIPALTQSGLATDTVRNLIRIDFLKMNATALSHLFFLCKIFVEHSDFR